MKATMLNHQPSSLPSLDTGRFVSALLVVLFHYSFMIMDFSNQIPAQGIFRSGYAGVNYFFVLSGFIIYYVHKRDLSEPQKVGTFLKKRAYRILPSLWIILLIWGILKIWLDKYSKHGGIDAYTLIFDMLLIPHDRAMVLGVTWTLQRELVFYCLFTLAIINRYIGFSIIVTWQFAIVAIAGIQLSSPFLASLLDINNLGFGFGLIVAVLLDVGSFKRARILACAGGAIFLALLALEWRIGGPLTPSFRPLGNNLSPILFAAAAALLIFGLARHDLEAEKCPASHMRLLGASSYVLYLIHEPLGSFLIRLLVRTPLAEAPNAMILIMTPIAVAVAVVFHLKVESPILRKLSKSYR